MSVDIEATIKTVWKYTGTPIKNWWAGRAARKQARDDLKKEIALMKRYTTKGRRSRMNAIKHSAGLPLLPISEEVASELKNMREAGLL
jgi:hypothetical protein